MYLKEISASGFKSFADKLTINLDGKTTCIVGPNGSGKSNIVDAVRWVLGEQSVKSLRGDNSMSDIIFSGSKSRNALNVASVSLTFDNSDNFVNMPYNEITVKRRVYRTGENEYFINGEKVRLKDVTDLFLDSGIGKSSFNIISQGEVQKLLSNSPYERRIIFESASGVLKYKKRKEEAIRKLEKTNLNLDRVEDIINELEVQIEPLRNQSIEAEKYIDIKEKLSSIEIALLAEEIDRLNYDYQKSKDYIEELNTKILNLNVKSDNQDIDLVSKKGDLLNIEKELKDLNDKLLVLTKEEERINGEKNILKERSKYKADDTRIHNNIINLKEDKLKRENDLYLIDKDILTLSNELSELKEQISVKQLDFNNINEKRITSLNEINSKKRELIEVEHRIDVTTNYIESGGNLSNTNKSIINNPKLKGIHNVLENLIDTEKDYIKALDVALGGSKQFIVVDDEICAKYAINYLKDNNLGRTTFFPLSIIKPKGVDTETIEILNSDVGFISLLSDKVLYDKKYYNIILNQLGNVILVDNIDSANRISKKIYNRYKIVTLDGEVIHVGGTISGGSLKTTRSIINEKIELENLERRKKDLERVVEELESNFNSIDEKISLIEKEGLELKTNYVELNEKITTRKNQEKELKQSLDEIENELKSLDNVIDSSMSKEEERIIEEYYKVSREKEELIKNINIINKDKDKLSQEIENMEATNKINNSNLYKLEKELKEYEISISKMDIKLDNYLNVLNEEYELTYEKARKNYVLEIDIDEARSEVLKLKNELKKIGMVNLQSIEDYKKVKERYDFLSNQKQDLLNAKDTLFEIISEMDTVMKEEFLNTFNKIEVEFKKVFKELFSGGNAELKLTDPKDLLETGVDIIASPPGKKLTSISLLSGGEKTLTAICLIFAILNVKQVPFCLFDEVEAALDEANVDNFGKYLNNYKDKTQFLIITHKKKTMEYANTLYGITMQESGVSKLVSVKLDKID